MRPFPGKNLSKERRIFNYRLSRARRMIACTFGILSSQWRIYKKPINTSVETATDIVKATIVLHNFRRQNNNNNTYCAFNTLNTENEIEFERAEALKEINNIDTNTNTFEASEIRNNFINYFNNIGAIS